MLVTGAAGMLGRDLVAHLAARHEVTAVDLEVDVTDPDAVARLRATTAGPRPSSTCAAWTDVDGGRGARGRGRARSTPTGAGNVAAAAAAVGRGAGAALDGLRLRRRQGAPYTEDDAPAPLGAYGRTKLAGERAARGAHPGGARVARTAWLYGAAGRNFVDTMRRLGRRARRGVRGRRPGGLAHLDPRPRPGARGPAGPARRACTTRPARGLGHLGRAWPRPSSRRPGLDCRVRPITTAELGRPAPRGRRCRALAVTRPGAPRLRALARGAGATTWRRRREAAGHRRLRLHRLGVRAPGPGARGRGGQPRQAHLRGQPGEPRRRGRRRGATASCTPTSPTPRPSPRRSRASTRWSTSPPRATSTAASSTRPSSSSTDVVGTAVLLDAARAGRRAALRAGLDRRGLRLDPHRGLPRDRPASAPPARTRPARPAATSRCWPGTAPTALDAVITRGSNTYGPRQYPEKLIPLFVTNALDGLPAAGLRRRHAGARLDPRGRPLRGHLDRPGAGRGRRGLQRGRRQRGAEPGDHPPHPRPHRARRVAGAPRGGPPGPRPPLRARHDASCAAWAGSRAAGFEEGLAATVRVVRATAATGGSRSRAASTGAYYEEQYGSR